jgi:methionyl-tRNA formyltransferase
LSPSARTIFLGTGSFAVAIVAALAEHPAAELVAIVTAPPRTGSRGKPAEPPVAQWAERAGVPLLRPTRLRTADSLDELAALESELLVLADYGQIVPAALLELPRHGALNLHPSLLPLYRGATPIPAAILAGDAETGVTLMKMDAGLDTGPVVAQWRTSLKGTETAPELEHALAEQAARLLAATLEHWIAGDITPEPQQESEATLTRPLRREDGRIDPDKPAAAIERQVRAYQPWPGSFLETENGRLAVWRAHLIEGRGEQLEVGALVRVDDGLALATADGMLALDEVQPAGGRRMTGAELVRGHPDLVGKSAIAASPGKAS